MNFSALYTLDQLLQAMPEALRALYLANEPRTNERSLFDWRDFIDSSFRWSDTNEGHAFWESVSQIETFSNWESCKTLCGLDHLRTMPDALRIMFFEEIKSRHGEAIEDMASNWQAGKIAISTKICPFYQYIGEYFNFDSSIYGKDFWRAVRDCNSTEMMQKVLNEWIKPVTLKSGATALRREAVRLDPYTYGNEAFALRSEAKFENNMWVLIADLATYYDSDNIKKQALRTKIENSGNYILIGEVYVNADIAHLHGKGRNMAGEWQDIDLANYAIIGRNLRFELIDRLSPHFVFVNSYRVGYKRYFSVDNSSVYKCEYSGMYYFEEEYSYNEYTFVSTDGTARRLKISSANQISPLWEIEGQRLASVRLENEGGRNINYFNLQSAINAGLAPTHCPHCNSTTSQHHDSDQCKRDNFKNERYSYHSKKPRHISSRSEFKIGVEIEKESYEGASHSCHDIYSFNGWVKESDGSLEGRIGYELVSPAFGLFGSNLIKEAEQLEAHFPELINGNASTACGGHIHFSKANTSGRDTLEMYCGYLPLLYAIYKGRTKQNYCKGMEKDEMKYSREKYQAVRVLDNRIEFRIFPAVKNLKTLIWRVELLRYMAKNPTASPVKVVNDLCDKRTNLHRLFLQIFSEQTLYKRALDTLTMAQKYDRNFYNIDFNKQRKSIEKKAFKSAKK